MAMAMTGWILEGRLDLKSFDLLPFQGAIHRSNTAISGAEPQRKGNTEVPSPLET